MLALGFDWCVKKNLITEKKTLLVLGKTENQVFDEAIEARVLNRYFKNVRFSIVLLEAYFQLYYF